MAGDRDRSSGRAGGVLRRRGERYGIGPGLLRAIAKVESGLDPRALHVNADGTTDIGLMQINSRWLPHLKGYHIEPEDLWDPWCG